MNPFVGISGWRYPGWRGVFYPPGLPQRRELEFAGRRFSSIEINGTFYSLQRASSFRQWRAETPPGFRFAVKGGRFITHMKKLRGAETALANFFASGLLELNEKLGPVLWQLAPRFRFDAPRLADFFALLPRDMAAAAALARGHDGRVREPGFGDGAARPIRHAIEVRHESFRDPAFADLLRNAGVALAISDAPGWPCFEEVTADFVYVRLHGAEQLYASAYSDAALDRWAARVRAWAAGREPPDAAKITASATPAVPCDVYVYFDNDAKVHAPFDALGLLRRLEAGEGASPPGREGAAPR